MMPMKLDQPDPPVYHSPFDSRAKLMNLQNLALQQQEGQQNLQLGQMKLAEGQRQVTEGQQIRDVFRNAPDLRSALPDVYKINPTVGMAMTKSLHEQEKSALDMETSRIGANEKRAGRLASIAGSANDEDSFHRAIATALDEKMMSPQEAQQALAEGWGPQSQAHMQQIVQMGLDAKEQATQHLANLKEQRDALDAKHKREMEPFQVTEAQNVSRKTGLEADELQRKLDMIKNTKPSDVLALVDQVVPPDVKANRALNLRTKFMVSAKLNQGDLAGAQDVIKTAAAEMRQLEVATDPRVQAAKVNVMVGGATGTANAMLGATPGGGGPGSNLHGEEYLSTLNNPALAAKVRNIVRGGDDLPTGRAAVSGAGALLSNAVYQYDPNYTPLLARKRKTELDDLTNTSGSSAGGKIVALNTMIHHGDLYQETADALDNGTFKPGNAVWNAVADAFGKAPPTQANLVAQFLAGETAKVAGENTGGAVNEILANLKNANSPDQIRGAGRTLIGIAAGRMVPYKERIADAKLENLAPPLLGPSAKAILVRRGFDPETMKPVQGGAGGAGPAGTIAVPLKSGRTAYMAPDAAAKFKRDHPELVK